MSTASRRAGGLYIRGRFAEQAAGRVSHEGSCAALPVDPKVQPILKLNPVVDVEGKQYYLAVQEMAAVRAKTLGAKVTSLEAQRAKIVAATDFLITGI